MSHLYSREMPFPPDIRGEEVNRLSERLASRKRINNTQAAALEHAHSPIMSAVAVFGIALNICRKRQANVAEARDDFSALFDTAGVGSVPITERQAEPSLDTAAQYGKGRGHLAQLEMGERLAYAMAMTYEKTPLFKRDDLSKTNVFPAL